MGRIILVLCIFLIGSTGIAEAQQIFSDDFDRGRFRRAWTEVVNFEVIQDPTVGWLNYVASAVDENEAHLVKDGLSLGPGTIARVFFYDYGPRDGDDHEAILDAGTESISIRMRYFDDTGNLPNSTNYLFDGGGSTFDTYIPRTIGWHEFMFEITNNGTNAYIDGINVGTSSLMRDATALGIASKGPKVLWDDVVITTIPPDPAISFSGRGSIAYTSDGQVVKSCNDLLGNCLKLCLNIDGNILSQEFPYSTISGVMYISPFEKPWEQVLFTAVADWENPPDTYYLTFPKVNRFPGAIAKMSQISPDAPTVPPSYKFRLQSIENGLSGGFVLYERQIPCIE